MFGSDESRPLPSPLTVRAPLQRPHGPPSITRLYQGGAHAGWAPATHGKGTSVARIGVIVLLHHVSAQGAGGRPAGKHPQLRVGRRSALRRSRQPPARASSTPPPMSASHSTGEPAGAGAVPPNPVEAPPVGAWPAPAASVKLTIWMPPPGAAMTISVWTVPAVSVTGRLVVALGPVALMVQVPLGMGACGLTLPGAASVVMLPGVPGAQLQWNVTVF